jgi:hypothetical protein
VASKQKSSPNPYFVVREVKGEAKSVRYVCASSEQRDARLKELLASGVSVDWMKVQDDVGVLETSDKSISTVQPVPHQPAANKESK